LANTPRPPEVEHELRQQVSYLHQLLSHNKRPIGLFLGAGCPMAIPSAGDASKPLIPSIPGLTKSVCTAVSSTGAKDTLVRVQAHLVEDGFVDPNIELILSRVRLMQQVCGKKDVRGLCLKELTGLEEAICSQVHAIMNVPLPNRLTPYHRVAAWAGSRPRTYPVEVFTPNYDLLMEQAFEEMRVPYFDGFIGSRQSFFDPVAMEADTLPPRWARLWKLHGSINWRRSKTKGGPVFRVGDVRLAPDQALVIHPSHLKYEESRKMPYLAMMDRLKGFLALPSAGLVICGYSFGDEHINDVILQGLSGNSQAVALGLVFGDLAARPVARDLALNCSNLALLAEDAAVLGCLEGKWTHGADTPEFKLGHFEELAQLMGRLVEGPLGEGGSENAQ
jgi:hypothetical protein